MTPQEAFEEDCHQHHIKCDKLESIIAVPLRRVVSDSELSEWGVLFPLTMKFLRTCYNKQQCGIRDRYLAWIDDRNTPHDLEFADTGIATGSHWSNKP